MTSKLVQGLDTARVAEVIITTIARRGNGTEASPNRCIVEFWDRDGIKLAEVDPCLDMLRQQGKLNGHVAEYIESVRAELHKRDDLIHNLTLESQTLHDQRDGAGVNADRLAAERHEANNQLQAEVQAHEQTKEKFAHLEEGYGRRGVELDTLNAELERTRTAFNDVNRSNIERGDRVHELTLALRWALGEEGDFEADKPATAKTFWWRTELRRRAGL